MTLMTTPKKKPGRPVDPNSKRSLGVNRHASPRKVFHLSQELLAAFDEYLSKTKPEPSEASALRLALEEFLEKRGFWPPKKGD